MASALARVGRWRCFRAPRSGYQKSELARGEEPRLDSTVGRLRPGDGHGRGVSSKAHRVRTGAAGKSGSRRSAPGILGPVWAELTQTRYHRSHRPAGRLTSARGAAAAFRLRSHRVAALRARTTVGRPGGLSRIALLWKPGCLGRGWRIANGEYARPHVSGHRPSLRLCDAAGVERDAALYQAPAAEVASPPRLSLDAAHSRRWSAFGVARAARASAARLEIDDQS